MLASVVPNGQSTTEVMLARSTDSGLTFSAPVRINDDANHQTKWHYFGTLSVAPNGRIDVVWYDTRNAANNIDSQLFYSFSTGCWSDMGCQHRSEQHIQSTSRLPAESKDRRLHHDRFGRDRRQCGICRYVQRQPGRRRRTRTRRLLRSGISIGRCDTHAYTDRQPNTYAYR